MCIDNRDIYAACAHCRLSDCGFLKCALFSPYPASDGSSCLSGDFDESGSQAPGHESASSVGSGVDDDFEPPPADNDASGGFELEHAAASMAPRRSVCPNYRTYVTVFPGFCIGCIMALLKRYGQRTMEESRSLRLVGRLWAKHAASNSAVAVGAPLPPASSAIMRRKKRSRQPAAPRLHKLRRNAVLQASHDFEGRQHWKRTLEAVLSRISPQEVLVGNLIYPDSPWWTGPSGERRSRIGDIALEAQVRTMRWAAGEDPDDFY